LIFFEKSIFYSLISYANAELKFGGSRFNTPLSPVAEDGQPLNNLDQACGKFVLEQPPLTRADLQKRRMAPPKLSPPSTFEPNWPGMPPQMRFGSSSVCIINLTRA